MALAPHCISGSESLWAEKDETTTGECLERLRTAPNGAQDQRLRKLLFHARELRETSRRFAVQAPDRQNRLHYNVSRLPAARDWTVLRRIAYPRHFSTEQMTEEKLRRSFSVQQVR
jgi:hypothetical protein